MQYPFMIDTVDPLWQNTTLLIDLENELTTFLGMQSASRMIYLPKSCYRYKHKRMIIAIWPEDQITKAIEVNLMQWSK